MTYRVRFSNNASVAVLLADDLSSDHRPVRGRAGQRNVEVGD